MISSIPAMIPDSHAPRWARRAWRCADAGSHSSGPGQAVHGFDADMRAPRILDARRVDSAGRRRPRNAGKVAPVTHRADRMPARAALHSSQRPEAGPRDVAIH